MTCIGCNATENFIFSLKYRQRKVDLNTSKKSLVYVTIHNFIVQLSYAKISYLRKNSHLRIDAIHLSLSHHIQNIGYLVLPNCLFFDTLVHLNLSIFLLIERGRFL